MKAFFISLFLVMMGGCATSIPPVAGESLQGLRSERIATSYTLAEKRISYQEQLFRVLFVESKVSTQDFSGVWNPDADLSDDLASRLRAEGFSADSVYRVADKSLVESAANYWAKANLAASTEMHPTFKTSKLPPAWAFFHAPPTGEANHSLMKTLREKGYRYWVQTIAMDIRALAAGYGMVGVEARPIGRVIDLQTERVIWIAQPNHKEIFQLGGDLKALEADDMKKIKEGMRAGIAKIQFATMWGFSAPK